MLINNKKLRLVSCRTRPLFLDWFSICAHATGYGAVQHAVAGWNDSAARRRKLASGTLGDALLSASPESNPRKLENGLNFPRSGHTATVLPDGTVFIFGGVGADGKLVTTSELFDPATQKFTVLTDVLAVPRAFHTAVVLTDGSLLLAGGITAGNQFPDDVQILDFRSRKALSFHALLSIPREGHAAALLSDGSVRISGGTDHFGRSVAAGELYDPASKRFRFMGQGEDQLLSDDSGPTRIAASIPEDGTANVSILPLLSIRFSQLLDVRSANAANFVLIGPNEKPVPCKGFSSRGWQACVRHSKFRPDAGNALHPTHQRCYQCRRRASS